MKVLRDAIFAKMASRIHKNEVQFRISGGAVNVARFLSGRPDCFAASVRSNQIKDLKEAEGAADGRERRRERSRVARHVLCSGRCRGHTDRGAGAGRLSSASGHDQPRHCGHLGTQKVRLTSRIKEAGEVVQLDKLAFCLAHPALHRKLNFSLRLKHAGWIGGSIDVPLEERGDIYIDAADAGPRVRGLTRSRRRHGFWRN